VRDAYRLLRHLRDKGRSLAKDSKQPGVEYTLHGALVILRRLRERLFPEPPPNTAAPTSQRSAAELTAGGAGHSDLPT